MFTGMRAGEILNAPENCLIELNQNNRDIYILNSYTNKETNKAPRVFGFIGNASIIYILCYDPFHKIYSSTGKI